MDAFNHANRSSIDALMTIEEARAIFLAMKKNNPIIDRLVRQLDLYPSVTKVKQN